MVNKRKVFSCAAGFYALANFGAFILFFLFTNFEGIADTEVGVSIYAYIIAPLMKGFDILIPISAAFLLYVAMQAAGTKNTLVYAIPIALSRFIYLFLYYYLYFVYNGYSSVEACGLSALWSLLGCALHYALIIALFFACRFLIYRSCDNESRTDILYDRSIFNFGNSFSRISMIFSAVGFVHLFVRDAIESVIFLVECDFNITIPELCSILIAFFVDFLFLFIVHVCNMTIKNKAVDKLEAQNQN